MSGSPFSASWYRVADLTPRLRPHARIHRHRYRGRVTYVLEDLSSQRHHRFGPEANAVIGLMDGERTLDAIWRSACRTLGDDAPTQDEVIQLLGQLHAADVLQCDAPPDTAELLERLEKKERREWRGRFMNPLAIRIPLVDPDRFLVRTLPAVRPWIGWLGGSLWLAVVLPALVLVAVHWSELTGGFLDRALSAGNLAVIWLLFPVLKVMHELGHGYATRRYGGEVHDMGVMLLVFTPVPYVDASAASAFREKSRRMLVGAAGMIVEIFLAALAVWVWVAVEPGPIRTLAWNAMLIGGVTTLAFNANPLLRFDGYYVLADWLEIPNLRARSTGYLKYLLERYGYGRRETERPDEPDGVRRWLVGFGVAAFLYRLVVVAAILGLVLDWSLVLGTILGAVAIVGWFGVPLAKGLHDLFTHPRLRRERPRAITLLAGFVAAVLVLVAVVPVPHRTRAEGVVWLPEEAVVRAKTEGFVARVVAAPGGPVAPGDVLFELVNADLERSVRVDEARLRELRARLARERMESVARGLLLEEEIRLAEQRLARTRERREELVLRAAVAGRFVAPKALDLPGRFVRQGQVLGHVLDIDAVRVRTVVEASDIDLVYEDTRAVDVRLAESLDRVLPATLERAVPKAIDELPSVALGTAGGGGVAVDPTDESGARALRRPFQVDLFVAALEDVGRAGGRVYVRFDHGRRPLAAQWWRDLRQVFLSRFDV